MLEKAGRHREADVERRKLPQEEPKQLSVRDQFAEAARLRGSASKRAIETYRQAFKAFTADPFKNELKASDLAGYVQTVREEDGLDQIMKRLWELRARVVSETETPNTLQAGKARALLGMLDSAVAEAVGGVAAEKATGDELSALFTFLKEQTESTLAKSGDQSGTLAFLRDLSRRAGFGSLDEEVLTALKDRSYSLRDWPSYHSHLGALVDFYDERGAYKRIVDLLEAERSRDQKRDGFEYSRLIAQNARLIGDNVRELQALRDNYQKPISNPGQLATTQDPLVERYFEALFETGDVGKNELLSCARQPTSHQLQLVNFLLRKGDKELAHVAIDNSPLPTVWKLSRNAEASLDLREFEARNEGYFLAALQYQPIGELIRQQPDTAQQLVGDDWFHLAQTYGRWLYSSAGPEQKLKSRALLPAMIENRPLDINEQARLGRWYLERNDADQALEHLALAHESQPEDKGIIAALGSAFFLRGDRSKAEELWEQILSGEPSIDDCRLYGETLARHNLNEQARRRLTPLVTRRLQRDFQEERENESSERQSDFENFKRLIRMLASSFSVRDRSAANDSGRPNPASVVLEAAKAKFFRDLCASAPDNRFLPEFLIGESLVARDEAGSFYQILIKRSAGLTRYDRDYAFTALKEKSFDDSDLEEALDQERDYKPSAPECRKIRWQREYLEYLIEQNQNAEARRLISAIEGEIKHRYARPVWLRLSALRLDLRDGRAAQAFDGLAHLIGIKTGRNLIAAKPPSIERLNDALALLRDEGRDAEARSLSEAAYAREIALEQFEPAYFAGLARIAFEQGDQALGLKWLQSMVDLTIAERKEETALALTAMPVIKAHSVAESGVALPAATTGMERTKALQLAAETAGEFAQFEAAIDFRRQLLIASPEDEENRIELVRLLAANKNAGEAIQNLAAIIGDRTATRSLRWQAGWLAPEIAEQKSELWQSLRERVQALNAADNEMSVALESLSLSGSGHVPQAIALVASAESRDPNPYLMTLRAFHEEKLRSDGDALNSFTRALIAARESRAWQSFSFAADAPLEQMVALYLKQNQPRAALKLAERVAALQANKNTSQSGGRAVAETDMPESKSEKYQTLRARSAARERSAHAELLELLSVAAEQIGDLNRAHELERTRLALLLNSAERLAAQARLDRLRELQRQAARQRKSPLAFDLKLVAGG